MSANSSIFSITAHEFCIDVQNTTSYMIHNYVCPRLGINDHLYPKYIGVLIKNSFIPSLGYGYVQKRLADVLVYLVVGRFITIYDSQS